jgi:hypothetical protein
MRLVFLGKHDKRIIVAEIYYIGKKTTYKKDKKRGRGEGNQSHPPQKTKRHTDN